ncbi:MAG: hypothetical protein AAB686_00260, partial [Patescibacteria group bacterium]
PEGQEPPPPGCTPSPSCAILGCGQTDNCGTYCGDCAPPPPPPPPPPGGGNSPPSKPGIPDEYKPSGATWDNCIFAGKSIPTFHWTYSDPNNDLQAAYEIEVDDNAAFAAPKFNHLVNVAATSYALDLSQDDNGDWLTALDWQTSYHWRVRVKDIPGAWSEWSSNNQFQTPNQAYPYSGFSWAPQTPNQGEVVVFTPDNSGYTYLWTITLGSATFTDNTTNASQNPHIIFNSRTNKVKLQVTQGSYSCTSQEYTISANLPLPGYREVSPFIWLKNFLLQLASGTKSLF